MKTLQIIPALPGTWAFYGTSMKDGITLSLPVVCWALIDEDGAQRIVPKTIEGCTGCEDAWDDDNFIGVGMLQPGEIPPAANVVATADRYYKFEDLKLDPGSM